MSLTAAVSVAAIACRSTYSAMWLGWAVVDAADHAIGGLVITPHLTSLGVSTLFALNAMIVRRARVTLSASLLAGAWAHIHVYKTSPRLGKGGGYLGNGVQPEG